MTRRHGLSRRAVLRGTASGTALALALPPLEAMFDGHGEAHADGSVPGPIFGVSFWANGLPWHAGHSVASARSGFDPEHHIDVWTPATTGTYTTPPPLLARLARHNPSVITGLRPQVDYDDPSEKDGHVRGWISALTSDRVNPEGFHFPSATFTVMRPTIDQVVADHPAFVGDQPTRYRALHTTVSTAQYFDYGHWQSISFNGPWSTNPPVSEPDVLWEQLFGVPPGAALDRSTMLDAVLDEYHVAMRSLGTADQRRLSDHMEHLYEVQRRLQTPAPACTPPGRPARPDGDFLARADALAEVLALGLSCGISRVFTYMLTSPGSPHLFTELDAIRNGYHLTAHAGEWDSVYAINELQFDALALMLDRLAATERRPGVSVLDDTLVFATSEVGEGWQHSVDEMPVLLAGGAGRGLTGNLHARERGGNLARAHLTMLQLLGLPYTSYGFNGATTDRPFDEFLA